MQRSEEFIPERVRVRLLAMGIPAADHDALALARFFPDEFNIGATELCAEDMANILIYLVEKGLFSVPGSGGLTAVKKVQPGWHFCQFYRDFNQLLNIIAPFVVEGLKNDEGAYG